MLCKIVLKSRYATRGQVERKLSIVDRELPAKIVTLFEKAFRQNRRLKRYEYSARNNSKYPE